MAKRDGYSATISYSTKDLNKFEKLMFAQSPDAASLEELTRSSSYITTVSYFVLVEVHNERNTAGEKDYTVCYIADNDGDLYKTSSSSCISNLQEIAEMLEEELAAGEAFPPIKFYQKPSKNRTGSSFITCNVHTGPLPVHKDGATPEPSPATDAEFKPAEEIEIPFSVTGY